MEVNSVRVDVILKKVWSDSNGVDVDSVGVEVDSVWVDVDSLNINMTQYIKLDKQIQLNVKYNGENPLSFEWVLSWKFAYFINYFDVIIVTL